MARMHSGKHGKSGSKKPLERSVPSWVGYGQTEIEMIIGKLAKQGLPPSQIGATLRDKYGIPDARSVLNKKITQFLKEKKQAPELPEDLIALIRKSAAIRKHMESNNHDKTAVRGLQLTESKIKRLVKYYKSTGRVAEDWKYDVQRASYYLN